jgi:hypothetical protein
MRLHRNPRSSNIQYLFINHNYRKIILYRPYFISAQYPIILYGAVQLTLPYGTIEKTTAIEVVSLFSWFLQYCYSSTLS